MEDIMLIRSSFLRRIISQVINKMLKKQLPGTEVQLGEVQANWSEKENGPRTHNLHNEVALYHLSCLLHKGT